MINRRRPFTSWFFEKLVEYGNEGGGMGWMIYWMVGLALVGLIDIVVLGSPILLYPYLIITFIFLVIKALQALYKQYLEETEIE